MPDLLRIIQNLPAIIRFDYKDKTMIMEPLQPFGLLIVADEIESNLDTLDQKQLLALVRKHKFVLLRQFDHFSQHELHQFSKRLGSLLAWEFGEIMEMRVIQQANNYLFTHEKVPLHWDGAFHTEPEFLLFHCLQAPDLNSGGETLFVDTEAVWQRANKTQQVIWQNCIIRYCTDKLAHYGGRIDIPLVQQHPVTANTILKYAEAVDTQLNPVTAEVLNISTEQSREILDDLARRCYEHQYEHAWQNNDYLLADNHALIHGRHAFKQFSPRHLRRIQILKEHQA